MARLTYRGVGVVIPEGEAIDGLLTRVADERLARRILGAINGTAREALRKLLASVYVAGLKEGVDRAIELGAGLDDAPGALIDDFEESEAPALADLRRGGSSVRSPIQAVVDRFRSSELRLPHMPHVAAQLNQALADPDVDISQVIELVRCDPALSAKVMAVASSTWFTRGSRRPKHLQDAVVRIGSRELSKYLLAFGNQRLFGVQGDNPDRLLRDLWHHALCTAVIAEGLALEIEGANPPTFFLHGLLHDIGRVFLLQIFDDMAADHRRPLEFTQDEIRRTIDSLHGQFGSAMLQKWRFDDSFSEVAMFHHQPQKSFQHMKLVACIALADAIAEHMGFTATDGEPAQIELSSHPAFELLDMDPAVVGENQAIWRRNFEALSTEV